EKLCWRFLVRRVARSRGLDSFGNARGLQVELDKVCERQALRLWTEWAEWRKRNGRQRNGNTREEYAQEKDNAKEDEQNPPQNENPNDVVLTSADIFGPEPSDVRERSVAYRELQNMVGLISVKAAIEELVSRASANYQREVQGKEPIQTHLNRVFLGPP